MQYNLEQSDLSVTLTAVNIDAVVNASAPLEINMSECARMDVGQAINYIKSGEAEIAAATDIGVNRIASAVTDGISDFDANATAKTTTFNTNASDKTGDFNTNAAAKIAEVDAEVAVAKQWAIGDPSEPTGYSAKYWANQASSVTSGLADRVTAIESDIPAQASSSNQLADKNFVNSSIATNTANFIGTFNSVADLEAYSGTLTNNDYAFVISTDAAGNTVYNRYKWNATQWLFEYALNNSSFTANQWAAINSGATTTNIGQIATNTSDITTINGKIPTAATASNQLADKLYVSTSLSTMLETLYPVGAIYIGTQATCPLATLISGSTWTLVSSGRVLQGADNDHAAGTTIAAGLPNIKGEAESYLSTQSGNDIKPPFVYVSSSSTHWQTGTSGYINYKNFDASTCSSIYGNSSTVQPPAFVVNIWQRTA